MNGKDHVKDVNKYINDHIRFADAKAGVVLTFVAAIGGLVGVVAPTMLGAARTLHWFAFLLGVAACGTVALAVLMVLWHALAAISPRTENVMSSLVSFPDIARQSPQEYETQVSNVTTEQVVREYARHNVTLSHIALAKFESLARAVSWMRVALTGAYVAALLYAVARVAV